MAEWANRLAELRGSRVIADKTDKTDTHAAPWDRLLAAAGPLRGTLESFRGQGCALNVIGDRIFFGPYDDFEGCIWRNAAEWHAAYAIVLAPHEVTLRDLLAKLLDEIEAEEIGGSGAVPL